MIARVALTESEVRFQASFDFAAVGLGHAAPDGRFLRVNRKLCDIVGYPREELLQRTFQDITYPADLDADLGCVRRVLAGEIESYTMEKRYIHKSGAIVWINLSVSLVRKQDGDPDYFLSIVEDITARKRAEEELREKETALANAMPGISVLDRAGCYERINQEYARMLGYEPAELLGRDWTAPVAPADQGPARAAHQRMMAEGRAEFEAMVVRKDGSSSFVHVLLVRRADPPGGLLGDHCFLRDISERRQAEAHRERLLREADEARQEAEAARRLLAGVIERVSDGFVALDNDWRYTYVNQRAAELLQRQKPEDLVGRHIWTEVPRRRRSALSQGLPRACETQQPVVLEEHYEPWDRWFENRIHPSADGLTIYFTEVTERKRAELAAQESRERLQRAQRVARLGFLDWNLKTNEIFLSEEARRLYGLEAEPGLMTPDLVARIVHPDDRAYVWDNLNLAIRGVKDYDIVHRAVRPDGEVVWVRAQAELSRDADGSPLSLSARSPTSPS
jgi:PAS domain S-box-containing protein